MYAITKSGIEFPLGTLNSNFFGHVQGLRDEKGLTLLKPSPFIYDPEQCGFSGHNFYDGDFDENAKHPEKYWRSISLSTCKRPPPQDVVVSMRAELALGTFWTEETVHFDLKPVYEGPELLHLVIDAEEGLGAWKLSGTYRAAPPLPDDAGMGKKAGEEEEEGIEKRIKKEKTEPVHEEEDFVPLTPPPLSSGVTNSSGANKLSDAKGLAGNPKNMSLGAPKGMSPASPKGMSSVRKPISEEEAFCSPHPTNTSSSSSSGQPCGVAEATRVWTGREDDCVFTGKKTN